MNERVNDTAERSLLENVLRSITRLAARHPRAMLWLIMLICCACIILTISLLKFRTSRADLIDPRADYHQRWLEYTAAFGQESDIVVVVESGDVRSIRTILDAIGTRLEREPELFVDPLYRVDFTRLRSKGLQFLTPAQLQSGLNRLGDYGPVLRGDWDLLSLESLVPRLTYQLTDRRQRQQPSKTLFQHAEVMVSSLDRMLSDPESFTSPWPRLVETDQQTMRDASGVMYLMDQSGTMGFLRVRPVNDPSDFSGSTQSITRLRDILDELRTEFPESRLGMTGIPVLEFDEMQRSQIDMLWASLISLAGVGIVLLTGFRGGRHPLLALLMLVVGMIWAFGYTTLAVGHLNILSVSFAAILIGLGIDFAIHYIARYLELRHEGRGLRPALSESSASVGTGILTAAITTSLAFFCASFTEFLGVAELGLIASGGILLCALATFVVLPALISVADRGLEPQTLPTPFRANGLRSIVARFPIAISVGTVGLVIMIALQSVRLDRGKFQFGVNYDYNLLNLQAEGLDSVDLQRRIFDVAGDSLLYAVAVADSASEARELRRRFEELPTVGRVEELATRLPASRPEETQALIARYLSQLKTIPTEVPRLPTPDPAIVGSGLEALLGELSRSADPDAVTGAKTLDRFLNAFESLSLRGQMNFLTEYQLRCSGALLAQFQQLALSASPRSVTIEDFPAAVRSRFISADNQWLVQVYPREQIWDIEPLERFVTDLRSVDPDVTGTPLQNYEASRAIMNSYETAALAALAMIITVLLIDYLNRDQRWFTLFPPGFVIGVVWVSLRMRGIQLDPMLLFGLYTAMALCIAGMLNFGRLLEVLLTLVPPLGGAIVTLGILVLLGIDLNPANLIVLPLVLGIGVDDGVHVVHDYRQQKDGYRISASTMNAIVLTSLTTMIGFGSLLIASHRGLRSIGLVMVIGVGACLFLSLVTLPALLTLSDRSRHSTDESGQTKPGSRRRSIATAA